MFTARLHERVVALDTRVCLGIDPRPELHGRGAGGTVAGVGGTGAGAAGTVADAVADYFERVLDATHDLVACCKPQSAFFEALGIAGLEALGRVMDRARSLGVPVLLDAKRGDIDTTAAAYATAYLRDGRLAADAMTVNAYLGLDSIEPFIDAAAAGGRGVFVLVKTSNPGSIDLQDVELVGGQRLYQHVAALLRDRAATLPRDPHGYTALGVVVGATHAAHLRELRSAVPRSVMLVPGYGAQGGSAADVAVAFDDAGLGAIVSASRSLSYPGGSPSGAHGARAATLEMRDAINRALAAR